MARIPPLTEEQKLEVLEALKTHGTKEAAARALDMARTTFQHRIAQAFKHPPPGWEPPPTPYRVQQGDAPEYDLTHPIPEGLTLKGTSIRYDEAGNVDQYWNKTKPQGRDPADTVQLPGARIVKVSKLYDAQGRVIQEWVSEKPEEAQREALWRETAAAFASEIPRTAPVAPPAETVDDLAVAYPVGDHHLGMLSWREETGADYDLSIGEELLFRATDHLISSVPATACAWLAILGDFLHYDSTESVTPASRNQLDADGRFPKMVWTAIRCVRYQIDRALTHHRIVHVEIIPGNHDPYSAIFLTACIRTAYENEPRVIVDDSPAPFRYFEFGRCLVGLTHGDRIKFDALPGIMAVDRPEAWGRTQHRYFWIGHVHHKHVKDMSGVTVESFPVLPPADFWATKSGYRAARKMSAIVLHHEFGEVQRHTVNPEMSLRDPA